MTQPWDYWHENGASGLTIFNTHEQVESAGVIGGGGDAAAPHMLCARPFWVGDSGIKVSAAGLSLSASNYTANNQPGACRFGIYACPPPAAHNMYPAQLLADFDELILAGATARPAKALASPLSLSVGFYYLTTLFRVATPAERTAGFKGLPSVTCQPLLGGPGFPLGNSPLSGLGFTGFATYFPYGALPASFPALAAGSFGVLNSGFHNAPFNIDYAIYVESAGTVAMNVSIVYDAGIALGTCSVVTDTAAAVTVRYNGDAGTPCPQASVVAALLGTANLVNAQSVGAAIDFNSTAFGSLITPLQKAGPLQVGSGNREGSFLPVTFASVVS